MSCVAEEKPGSCGLCGDFSHRDTGLGFFPPFFGVFGKLSGVFSGGLDVEGRVQRSHKEVPSNVEQELFCALPGGLRPWAIAGRGSCCFSTRKSLLKTLQNANQLGGGGESCSHKFPQLGALSHCKDVQGTVLSICNLTHLRCCHRSQRLLWFTSSLYLALASEVLPNQSQKVYYLSHKTVRSPK